MPYKLYCDECEGRFSISDETLDRFISDTSFLMKCPGCGSTAVNILGIEGQTDGF